MPGYIDNYARPENPVVDITGQPLSVVLRFADKGAALQSDHPLSSFAGLLSVPPDLLTLLTTPLSTTGDNYWSKNLGSDGKTQRDRTSAQIAGAIQKAVAGTGSKASDVHVSLPATGALKALLLSGSLTNPNASQLILLSYQLGGLGAEFTVSLPRSGNPIVGTLQNFLPDPTFRLVFDLELLIMIFVPRAPGPFQTTASFTTLNADIHGTNATATIGTAILDGIGFLTGQPGSIFQAAEGSVDGSMNATGDIGAFVDLLSKIGAIWPFASGTLGFDTAEAFIDGVPALGLRFVHPLDPAPTLQNAADSPFPSLFHPVLETDSTVVRAGGAVTALGSFFPLNQTAQLMIGWNDTTTGAVTRSVILFGLEGQPPKAETKPRASFDNQNFFVAKNLLAGRKYSFQVKDEDLLTETQLSEPLVLSTQATDSVELALAPQGGGLRVVVGTLTLSPNGEFSTPFTVPANLSGGKYILSASLAGQILASTGLRVIGSGEGFPPTLEALDPVTGVVVSGVSEGGKVRLHGSGFGPGNVTLTIDTDTGALLATTLADAAGDFRELITWPVGVIGQHSAEARQVGGGSVLSASADLLVQLIPR